ncbi:FAD binding domain-containing protein [Acetobacter conturbans]|uniref:Xanthine dehydrogenase family protein subunit M n=1 Tax=Acetobacter conturbans TaxID=1737472 RepID=A0ABX0K2U1_9PROT|nr:xanthine dehydrogenase family protein subunit M [Acetobacter conturbans]NHN90076.1 xanthine dehydrogenase family protein subunit M [Acetobacter conturbans]
MKASDFLYHRPESVPQVLGLLRDYAGGARILAGGQSLMPMMNLRLWRPAALIDIGRIPDLERLEQKGDVTILGPRFPYWRIENDRVIAERLPLLARMVRKVGDRQVRNRGTIGGSLVQADPTGEMPLGTLILGATIHAESIRGRRAIPVEQYFLGSYATAIEPDEMLVAVEYPRHPAYFSFAEVNRRHNDFAVVSVAVAGDRAADGTWHNLRIGLGGVDETPVLALAAMRRGEGTLLQAPDIAQMGILAAEHIDPPDDFRASADYRRHLTRVHLTRVLGSMLASAGFREE